MNEVWIVKAFHNKEVTIMRFLGAYIHLVKVLKRETADGNYNGGYLIYTEQTYAKHHKNKKK